MHLPHSIAIRPNLELKTQPKQLLGFLQFDIALPVQTYYLLQTYYGLLTDIIQTLCKLF